MRHYARLLSIIAARDADVDKRDRHAASVRAATGDENIISYRPGRRSDGFK